MSIENKDRPPVAKTETELERLMPEYAEMRDAIINVEVAANKMELQKRQADDINNEIVDRLSTIKVKIDQLAKKYPDNDSLRILMDMYEDISQDFIYSRKTRVDTSLQKRLAEVQKSVVDAGITTVPSENIDNPKTKELVAKMQQLGIPIERVTTRPNADRTVILIVWAHPNPGMNEEVRKEFGIFESQNKVNDYIAKLSQAGISNHVLTEGIPANISPELKAKVLAEMAQNGFPFINLTNISIEGVENKAFLLKTATDLSSANYQIRATINNIVMAHNIENSMRSGEVSIAVMGAAHEFEIDQSEHQLSYSQATSFEANANVIVINTAREFYEATRDPKKMELMKQAAANFQAGIKEQFSK
ncbi:MAG: hypothetical protein V1936_04835 [Patescibacteria group bacterium]